MLKFGDVSTYVGYNALEDYFPTMTLKPNQNCDDSKCIKKQAEYQLYIKEHPEVLIEEVKEETEVVHEDNDWGISLVESDPTNEEVSEETSLNLVPGLKVAYDIPSKPLKESHQEVELDDDAGESLDELMNRMKNI